MLVSKVGACAGIAFLWFIVATSLASDGLQLTEYTTHDLGEVVRLTHKQCQRHILEGLRSAYGSSIGAAACIAALIENKISNPSEGTFHSLKLIVEVSPQRCHTYLSLVRNYLDVY